MIFRILIAFFSYPVNPVDPVKVLRSVRKQPEAKMPFLCEPIVETQFASLKDVDNWLSTNESGIERAPIRDWIDGGLRFFDDEYFGNQDRFLRFNQNGMRVLLQKLGLRFDTLQRVERPGLISDLLNDLIVQRGPDGLFSQRQPRQISLRERFCRQHPAILEVYSQGGKWSRDRVRR